MTKCLRISNRFARRDPGSARLWRAGDRELYDWNSIHIRGVKEKACFGETPKPTYETRALPGALA
jgi:hypothetical protein